MAFLAAAFLAGFGRQLYWNHRQRTELARIRAAGEPVSSQEMGRVYPSLAFSENAFARLAQAGAVNWTRWVQATAAGQLLARFRKGDSNVVSDCERIITNNPGQISALHEIGAYEKAYFDPASDMRWRLPSDIPGYTGLAAAEMVKAMATRDSAGAVAALERLLKFAELLRAQPIFIVQVHCGHALSALSTGLECAIERNLLTPAELTSFQYRLDRLAQQRVLARMLAVERARFLAGLDRPDFGFPGPTPLPVAAVNGFSAIIGSKDRGLVALLQEYRRAIDLSGSPDRELLEAVQNAADNVPSMTVFIPKPASQLNAIVQTDAMNIARLRLLGTALAVERFRRERGTLPRELALLAPGFIGSVPVDPFSGAPLETLATAQKFVLRPPVLPHQKVVPGEKISFEFAAPAP
jgi:hypothetical protein